MDNTVFMILLLTGFCVASVSLENFYFFVNEKMTWSKARQYCKDNHIELVDIQNMDVLTAMLNTPTGGYTGKAWIGLYANTTQWYWMNGQIATYTSWKPGQPDNVNASEYCVAMDNNGFWYDYSCSDVKPCVCENELDNMKPVHKNGMTWTAAETSCYITGSFLAEIFDVRTNDVIARYLPNPSQAWIGLSRPNIWMWSDTGGIYRFINWQPGHPNNLLGSENCATVVVKDGTWTDEQCSTTYPFFCYDVYKLRVTTVQMKIQSNANLEDPAYSAVLQLQLQDAFAKKGFTDFKLTWTKLPVKPQENSDH